MTEIQLTPHEQDWLDREILRRLAELDSLFGLSKKERRAVENKLRRWGERILRDHRAERGELGEAEKKQLRWDGDLWMFS
jgi:hypothetical protein